MGDDARRGTPAAFHFLLEHVRHAFRHGGVGALPGTLQHGAAHDVAEFSDDGTRFDDDDVDAERGCFDAETIGPAFKCVLGGVIPAA